MQELYDNLMALVVPGDYTKFYFKDFTTPLGTNVRIFTYNYAAYEDWLKPDALESRGIMFEMKDGEPVRIMARPMQKFFNLGECPFTMDLDLNKIDHGMTKADGSLISTYHDQQFLRAKSKASIFSDQAIEAQQIFMAYDHQELHVRCLELALNGFTCNFEYVAPTNRIVIAYPERGLILLNVRHNETGEYIHYGTLAQDPVLRRYLVDATIPDVPGEEMVDVVRAMTDTEGYVFVMEDGLIFKLKTEWYSTLHRVKDTLNNNEALFETVVAAGSDDLKSLFDDQYSIDKINDFEKVFYSYLQTSLALLAEFHEEYRGQERKTYAIAAQTFFKQQNKFELFGISMLQYEGRVDQERTVEEINRVFLKNSAKYIPEKYIKVG